MTKTERKLFSLLIDKYIHGKISRVCSDFDAVEEAGLTLEECNDLHTRMAVWNGEPNEAQTGRYFYDWYLAAYLKHLFDSETEQ